MGRRSRAKRLSTRAERAAKRDRRAPAREVSFERVDSGTVRLHWVTDSGIRGQRDFGVYQDAQSRGYALLRGEW